MDVLRGPPHASAQNLIDPRVTEACQLADATMREPERRNSAHRALTLVLSCCESRIGTSLGCCVLSLCL